MTATLTISIMLGSLLVVCIIAGIAWWLGRRDLRQGAAVKVERSELRVQSAEEAEIERVNKLNLERLLKEMKEP